MAWDFGLWKPLASFDLTVAPEGKVTAEQRPPRLMLTQSRPSLALAILGILLLVAGVLLVVIAAEPRLTLLASILVPPAWVLAKHWWERPWRIEAFDGRLRVQTRSTDHTYDRGQLAGVALLRTFDLKAPQRRGLPPELAPRFLVTVDVPGRDLDVAIVADERYARWLAEALATCLRCPVHLRDGLDQPPAVRAMDLATQMRTGRLKVPRPGLVPQRLQARMVGGALEIRTASGPRSSEADSGRSRLMSYLGWSLMAFGLATAGRGTFAGRDLDPLGDPSALWIGGTFAAVGFLLVVISAVLRAAERSVVRLKGTVLSWRPHNRRFASPMFLDLAQVNLIVAHPTRSPLHRGLHVVGPTGFHGFGFQWLESDELGWIRDALLATAARNLAVAPSPPRPAPQPTSAAPKPPRRATPGP